jgi:hypothetical protein
LLSLIGRSVLDGSLHGANRIVLEDEISTSARNDAKELLHQLLSLLLGDV